MKKGILTIAGMLLTVSLVSAGTTVPVLAADEETTLVYGSGDYTRINPANGRTWRDQYSDLQRFNCT